jgi:integrase
VGEICKLKWTDVNEANMTISVNAPEKRGRPRTIRVSPKAISMISAMPKKYGEYIFNPRPQSLKDSFQTVRNRLVIEQQNPRLKQIHLHSFRHWRATKEYYRTNNLLAVKYLLRHKSMLSTERYTHYVELREEQYYSATARTVEECRKLIEDGWTYVMDIDGTKLFRKPK